MPDRVPTMRKRADFLAANAGKRVARAGFVLLAHPNDGRHVRLGITVTKKIGNAVVRNRMKRRFRELANECLPELAQDHHDYVLIGRAGGIEQDYARLRADLNEALVRLAQGQADPPWRPRRGNRRRDRSPGTRSRSGGGAVPQ